MEIKKAAVIGSGVMGSGIAAHIANAGVPVVLMDIVPEGANNRNTLAEGAIERMLKQDPAPFMSKRNARLVEPANLEDDLDKLGEADWIVEAVIENLDIKHDVYAKIEENRKKGSIVSSNTSTIPLAQLVKGLPDAFAKDFIITHFFNPPRYLRLLEIVEGKKSSKKAVETIRAFADEKLGKSVVMCKDTPGFIANRIGSLFMQAAINGAIEHGLTVEEADAIAGRPMGVPKTGVFGLVDLVGLDLMPHVGRSLKSNLPEDDLYARDYKEHELFAKMIEEGYTGRKGKGGFYRMNKEGGKRVKESIDLVTGEYAPSVKPQLESIDAAKKDLKKLVTYDDKGGRYAWQVLSKALSYSADLVPEIADTIVDVDEAMRTGYAWKWGPFELIDKLGPKWFAGKLAEDGIEVPELLNKVGEGTFYRVEEGRLQYFGTDGKYHDVVRPDGVLLLEDVKRQSERIAGNSGASLWDIGDGVACLEFHTKMNSIDDQIVAMLEKSRKTVEKDFKALVIYNEGSNFSVGANVGLALFAANVGAWPMIDGNIEQGQQAMLALKYAPFPVVSAPSGMALGGGCEVLLHSAAVQAHAETYTGLVEVGVGVIPGWGGCKEMILRWSNNPKHPNGPMTGPAKAFELISTAQVAKSAAEARDLGVLRPDDGITMNRDRLLADAKARALAMVDGYAPPEEPEIRLPGPSGKAAMQLAVEGFAQQGQALPHDVTVSMELATVLSGGNTDMTEVMTEKDVMALERDAFVNLLKTEGTLLRMEHMLTTGKPLRN